MQDFILSVIIEVSHIVCKKNQGGKFYKKPPARIFEMSLQAAVTLILCYHFTVTVKYFFSTIPFES